MAFAMTFFTLDNCEETKGFESIPHSLLTAFAMMAGEINYHEGEGFLGKISGTRQGFTITTFWVIAVIVLSILISNLLTALAIGDTSEVLRRSIGERRVQRVNKTFSRSQRYFVTVSTHVKTHNLLQIVNKRE